MAIFAWAHWLGVTAWKDAITHIVYTAAESANVQGDEMGFRPVRNQDTWVHRSHDHFWSSALDSMYRCRREPKCIPGDAQAALWDSHRDMPLGHQVLELVGEPTQICFFNAATGYACQIPRVSRHTFAATCGENKAPSRNLRWMWKPSPASTLQTGITLQIDRAVILKSHT